MNWDKQRLDGYFSQKKQQNILDLKDECVNSNGFSKELNYDSVWNAES